VHSHQPAWSELHQIADWHRELRSHQPA
jgi:hypothetical protein